MTSVNKDFYRTDSMQSKLATYFGTKPVTKADLETFKDVAGVKSWVSKSAMVSLVIAAICILIGDLDLVAGLAVVFSFVVFYTHLSRMSGFTLQTRLIDLDKIPNQVLTRAKESDATANELVQLLAQQDNKIYEFQVDELMDVDRRHEREQLLDSIKSKLGGTDQDGEASLKP
ncbi:hypothetical protein [Marinobacter sp.]|uniref:hypothetical protein n=1 Tax=Marinobacter sp. TaxID=50741 RepID=UPI002635375B|nr:hypothetical protein [Marinobacter sp.]